MDVYDITIKITTKKNYRVEAPDMATAHMLALEQAFAEKMDHPEADVHLDSVTGPMEWSFHDDA